VKLNLGRESFVNRKAKYGISNNNMFFGVAIDEMTMIPKGKSPALARRPIPVGFLSCPRVGRWGNWV
jgi:hypothetical protein